MSELYWINVLGSFSYISSLFCVVFGIATIICFVWSIAVVIEEDIDDKIRQLPKKYSATEYNINKKIITTEENNALKIDTLYYFTKKIK